VILSSEALHWVPPFKAITACSRHDTRNLDDPFEFVTARPEAIDSVTCPECRRAAEAWLQAYHEDLLRLSRSQGCGS
jgi:hypothetical protein